MTSRDDSVKRGNVAEPILSSEIIDIVLTRNPLATEAYLERDPELNAAVRAALPPTSVDPHATIKFGLASSDADITKRSCVIISVWLPVGNLPPYDTVRSSYEAGRGEEADFLLQARPEDWRSFFSPPQELVRPYQSFWGMLRVLSPHHPEVCVTGGDEKKFGVQARIWRIVLDRLRDYLTTPTGPASPQPKPVIDLEFPSDEENGEDALTGKYTWINHAEYGKVKIFYETSGTGPQLILFLHTAGSDSRQYHSLMNNLILSEKCTMYTFDLPAHGRSALGTKQVAEGYALTEESYLESISLIIKNLNLSRSDNLILCGASMAGHICLAAAIYASDLGVRGVIPCEGCAHLPFSQPIYEVTGADSAILDPERVCGMIAPGSPEYYKRQIWWQYSSQGVDTFAGDLKFYFKGWDGRRRLKNIPRTVLCIC